MATNQGLMFCKYYGNAAGTKVSVHYREGGCSSGVAINRGSTGCYRYCQCSQYTIYHVYISVLGVSSDTKLIVDYQNVMVQLQLERTKRVR